MSTNCAQDREEPSTLLWNFMNQTDDLCLLKFFALTLTPRVLYPPRVWTKLCSFCTSAAVYIHYFCSASDETRLDYVEHHCELIEVLVAARYMEVKQSHAQKRIQVRIVPSIINGSMSRFES